MVEAGELLSVSSKSPHGVRVTMLGQRAPASGAPEPVRAGAGSETAFGHRAIKVGQRAIPKTRA